MLGEVTPCVGLGKLSAMSKIRFKIQCPLDAPGNILSYQLKSHNPLAVPSFIT